MHFKDLSDESLIYSAEKAVLGERQSTADVIRHFKEISQRKTYLKYGFANLYDMALGHFKYCAGAAMRRINSMNLMQDVPEIESKLESSELSLTVAANIQSFLYAEERLGRSYSLNAKRELIDSCLGKSVREAEREFKRRNPDREKPETIHYVSKDRLRISLTISEELNQKLQHLKDLLSHSSPHLSTEELLDRLAEVALDKYDPKRKAERSETRARAKDKSASPPPPAEVEPASNETVNQRQSRHIPASEQHRLMLKYDGKGCEFVDPVTQRRCCSKRFIEKDHVRFYSYGGPHDAENLQMLCSAHNKFRWDQRHSPVRERPIFYEYYSLVAARGFSPQTTFEKNPRSL